MKPSLSLLLSLALAGVSLAEQPKIAVMETALGLSADVASFAAAKETGYNAIQMHSGKPEGMKRGAVDPAASLAIGEDPAELWRRVHQMVSDVLSVFVGPMEVITSVYTPTPSSCFELLGLDVLVDTDLRPWLLECNLSPSLATRSSAQSPSGRAQRRAKHRVVADMFSLLGFGRSGRTGVPGTPGGFEPVHGAWPS